MRPTRPRWVLQLPNAITVTRLAAIPLVLIFALRTSGNVSKTAGWTFAAVAFTDFVDGRLARALHAESRFGALADPLCDRLLVASGIVALLALDRFSVWGPVALLVRDLLAVAGFGLMASKGMDPRVDLPGKISSGLVMVAVPIAMGYRTWWADALFWLALAGSILSFVNYAARVPSKRRLQMTRQGSDVG